MDDVIERMAEVVQERLSGFYVIVNAADIQAALRAVHDTHRLIRVNSSHNEFQRLEALGDYDLDRVEWLWSKFLEDSPDYTEDE